MASSNITLSAGVRSNLLSLQNTADLMGRTQTRLATGKKVNSALDNPTNFFTSASLQSRANDMSALLDNMSSGIKTLEAADNGISAITKTIESMQSTLRQARQDKSYKTGAYSLALPTTPTGNERLTFEGGIVGDLPVSIALTKNTGGTANPATKATIAGGAFTAVNLETADAAPASITAGTAYTAVDLEDTAATQDFTFAGPMAFDNAGDEFEFAVEFDNSGTTQTFTITATEVEAALGTGVTTISSASDLADVINDMGITGGTATASGTTLSFTSATTGTASQIDITGTTVTDGGGAALTNTSGISNQAAVMGAAGAEIAFDLIVDGDTASISLDAASVAAADDGAVTAAELVAEINDQANTALGTTGVNYASVNAGGRIVFSSGTTGTASTIEIDNTAGALTTGIADAAEVAGTPAGTTEGTISFNLTTEAGTASINLNAANVTAVDDGAVTAAELATAINAQANTQLGTTGVVYASVGAGGGLEFQSGITGSSGSVEITGFAAAGPATTSGIANGTEVNGTDLSYTGGTNTAKTVDELVAEINSSDTSNALYGKIRASNDSGKLRIENLSTSELTVTGLTDGAISGGLGTSEIGGNTVRANLIDQYNALRDQLNKLADDASFNGVNLLRGDKLKLTFNETGTSTMEIQAKDETGMERPINAATLEIDYALAGDFDLDADLDVRLDDLQTSLGTLRSQASAFGSNLSIVQNRTEFTKNMVNTLQTGADSLVLADTNEEAANMLALQTRQQLSSTALSLASQADQAVLRLF